MSREKRKKIIDRTIIVLILIIALSFLILKVYQKELKIKEQEKEEQAYKQEIQKQKQSQIEYQENTDLEQLKQNIGATGNSNFYTVETETDGRKVLVIKANLQYKIAFAGMISRQKPELDKIDKIYEENHPTENGIWIEKQSQKVFLETLEKMTEYQYEITEKGYLKQKETNHSQNEKDKQINKLLKKEKQYLITIQDTNYQMDPITGEIIDNPFTKIDAYQSYEIVEDQNKIVTFISSNQKQVLKQEQILQNVLDLWSTL